MKTMQMIDGVKVLKLSETHVDEQGTPSDGMALFHIWSLLTGADQLRDLTVGNRQVQ